MYQVQKSKYAFKIVVLYTTEDSCAASSRIDREHAANKRQQNGREAFFCEPFNHFVFAGLSMQSGLFTYFLRGNVSWIQ
jgi:hypothetical protein